MPWLFLPLATVMRTSSGMELMMTTMMRTHLVIPMRRRNRQWLSQEWSRGIYFLLLVLLQLQSMPVVEIMAVMFSTFAMLMMMMMRRSHQWKSREWSWGRYFLLLLLQLLRSIPVGVVFINAGNSFLMKRDNTLCHNQSAGRVGWWLSTTRNRRK